MGWMDGICGFPGNTIQFYSYREEWRDRDRGIILLTQTYTVKEWVRDWNLETNVNKENVFVFRGYFLYYLNVTLSLEPKHVVYF